MSVSAATLTPDTDRLVPGAGAIAEPDPATLREMLARIGAQDFDRWQQQAANCGYCARPVRLRGSTVEHRQDGTQTVVWSSVRDEPDGVLLVACKNRRAAVCPSCAYRYAGDMWQLLYAGAVGGRKGVPEDVRANPLDFATLTAPSFGPVHTTRADKTGKHGNAGRCHPPVNGKFRLCRHGRATWCAKVHREDDPCLGEPLCLDCYDYLAHAAFNWWAPELFRRFGIHLWRNLARRAGVTQKAWPKLARVSYAKVGEFQRRAVVHFHALIRLDGPNGQDTPHVDLDAHDLADAIREAAAAVRLVVPTYPHGPVLELRFGTQIDAEPINNHQGGELTPERVAAYLAKYATKSAEDFGLGTRRISLDLVPGLGLTEHTERLVRACWELGQYPDRLRQWCVAGCGWNGNAATCPRCGSPTQVEGDDRKTPYVSLRRWLHMLGFRGHFASKSRRYSTTLAAIRRERENHRKNQQTGEQNIRRLDDDQADEDTTLVVTRWQYLGVGYTTTGDAALALSAAARAREQRRVAAEELRCQTA